MTIDMNKHVPPKRIEPEPPTNVHGQQGPEEAEHKKMERMADRAANKANKTEQKFDENQNTFTI